MFFHVFVILALITEYNAYFSTIFHQLYRLAKTCILLSLGSSLFGNFSFIQSFDFEKLNGNDKF